MKHEVQIKVFVAFFVGLLEICSARQAYAIFPALDTSSLVQGIGQLKTAIKESTVVVNTMERVKKTSAAIGTAKETVTEYVVNAKEEIEETIRKVNEYKKQVEEYVEEVKEYKEKVDAEIEKGKQAVANGKEIVANAKDVTSGAVEGVKSKIEDKTGISLDKKETQPEVQEVSTGVSLSQNTQQFIDETPATTSTRKVFDGAIEKNNQLDPQAVAQEVIGTATIESIKVTEEQKAVKSEDASKIKKIEPETLQVKDQPQKVLDRIIKKNVPAVSSTRKAFTTSSLHYEESLSFAFAITGLPDDGTNINGTVIIPKMLAMTCNLTSETALEKGNMDKCFSFLNDHRLQAQSGDPIEAPRVFNDAIIYYSALNIAEAIKAINNADSFEENFIEPVEFAPDSNAQDTYGNIIEMNKLVDTQMNSLLNMLSTNVIMDVIYNYKSNLYSSNKDFQPIYGDKIASDTGTGADGIMLLPKSMAKACGIGSTEATNEEAIDECFNTIAGIKGDGVYELLKNEILRELNQNAIELALKIKSESGDFKDKQKEALGGNEGVQNFSAAAGGIAEGVDGTDIRKSQIDNIALSTLSAQNLLKIIDLYSAKQNLNLMYNFYIYDAPSRRGAIKAKQMTEM